MALLKALAAAAVGVLAFSTDVKAKDAGSSGGGSTTTNTSSAKCSVVAIGYSEVSNTEAIASSVTDANAYICGHGTDSAEDIAEDTAEAFALAVATASAECDLSGDASAYVNAYANAKAAAEVFVAAYANAWAVATVCEKCDAYATSFGYVEKYVFLEAVASTGFSFSAYTSGGSQLVVSVLAFKAEIQRVVAKSFAVALAGAAAHKNSDGCVAWVNTGGCIWTPDNPDPEACFECAAGAVSAGYILEIDALAKASAKASAYTCADHPVEVVEAEDAAKDVALAVAIAVSEAFAACYVDGEGYACAEAGTWIEETAHAVAVAYAELWADSVSCDTCKVNVDAWVEATSDVIVTAATDAFAHVCSNGGYWAVAALAAEIEAATVTAIAEASVAAISFAPHVCVAGGYIEATTH